MQIQARQLVSQLFQGRDSSFFLWRQTELAGQNPGCSVHPSLASPYAPGWVEVEQSLFREALEITANCQPQGSTISNRKTTAVMHKPLSVVRSADVKCSHPSRLQWFKTPPGFSTYIFPIQLFMLIILFHQDGSFAFIKGSS